jgi:hypothetical protein
MGQIRQRHFHYRDNAGAKNAADMDDLRHKGGRLNAALGTIVHLYWIS